MYQYTTHEKKILKNLSHTSDGKELKKILDNIKNTVMDVSDISENYDVQVEARKIVKKFIIELKEMLSVKETGSALNDVDDFS